MKKLFTLIAAAIVATAAWADTVTMHPTAEKSFRTNGGYDSENTEFTNPTGWQSGFPKDETDGNNHAIECNYYTRMWAQQMYDVTNVDMDNITSIALTYNIQNNSSYRIGVWSYPGEDWTTEEAQTWTDDKCPVVENFNKVVGAYPGYRLGTSQSSATYLAYCNESNTDLIKQKQVVNITGNALEKIKSNVLKQGDRKYISFIITFRETWASPSSRAVKFYSIQAEEAKQTTMTIETAGAVGDYDVWTMGNFVSARTGGNVEADGSSINVTSGSDNAKRGDIKNTADVMRLGGNKVVFYEIACTAAGVQLNENDKKMGFTTTIDAYSTTPVINEQMLKAGTLEPANGHQVVYFDLSAKNANVAYFQGDSSNKFDTDTKNCFREALTAANSVSLSNVNFTLIGTDATNFVIYKMGSAKDVNTLKAQYGLEEKPAVVNQETGAGYDNLADAVAAIEETGVATLVLNKDITINARVNIKDKDITITGATGKEKIIRAAGYKGLLFLTAAPSESTETATYESIITLENITIDGASVEATGAVIEAANSGITYLNNVKFVNCINTTGKQGILCNKNKGILMINGVAMSGCTATESKALVFAGTSNVTLSGTNDFGAIHVEKNLYLNNDAANGVQEIIVDADREAGIIVKNGNVANYTVTGSSLPLNQVGNDVFLGEPTAIDAVNVGQQAAVNAARYNLNGQRVNGNAKGIIIINGKKVVK